MATLNDTPSSNRIHIGIFGKTNSGKSSFLNALTKQMVSIVSSVEGTTTDVVYKAMEINPLGPCVVMDTAGFGDESELGAKRIEKTMLAAQKADMAIIVLAVDAIISGEAFTEEQRMYQYFQQKNTPAMIVLNKIDVVENNVEKASVLKEIEKIFSFTEDKAREQILVVSAKTGEGMEKVRTSLARLLPENYGEETITGNLILENDLVLLVMPQDIQAPKGRLILPQVQTIRELLDKKCHVMSVTKEQFLSALDLLVKPPKLIIVDSQIFDFVYKNKPKESMLTSFSVLFAAYKGDIDYYLEGARTIDSLTENAKVLIAECCTHAPLSEDIGRVKIPRLLRKRFGEKLTIDMVSGTDFPEDLEQYDLVIQCGACMFHRKYVLARIGKAKEKKVPMTNYGVTIAHLTGILDQVVIPNTHTGFTQ